MLDLPVFHLVPLDGRGSETKSHYPSFDSVLLVSNSDATRIHISHRQINRHRSPQYEAGERLTVESELTSVPVIKFMDNLVVRVCVRIHLYLLTEAITPR